MEARISLITLGVSDLDGFLRDVANNPALPHA